MFTAKICNRLLMQFWLHLENLTNRCLRDDFSFENERFVNVYPTLVHKRFYKKVRKTVA